MISSITFITLIVIILAFRIFIGYSLEVGGTKYFINQLNIKIIKNALESNLCSYEDLLLNQQISDNNMW